MFTNRTFGVRMFGDRSGSEPTSARSPLKLRLVLAVFGAIVLCLGAGRAFTREDPEGGVLLLGAVAALFALVAVVDVVLVLTALNRLDTPHSHRRKPS